VLEDLAHQAQRLGEIVAVGDALVDGEAELDRVAELVAAVLLEERTKQEIVPQLKRWW